MAKLGEKPSSGAPLRHRATTENVRDIRRRPHTRPLEGQRKLKWEDKRTGRRSTRTTLALRGEARDDAATPADDEKLRKRRRSLTLGNGTRRSPPGRNDENRGTPRSGESQRWAKGNRTVRRGRSDGEAVCAETREATSKLKETEGKVFGRSSTMLTRGAMDGGPGPDGAVTAERAKGGPGPEDGTKSEATRQRWRRPARNAEQTKTAWRLGGRRRGRAKVGSRCGSASTDRSGTLWGT
jgi:hypothetical protein